MVCRHQQLAVWHNTPYTVILQLYVYVILSRDGLNVPETCGWGLTGDSLGHTSAEVFGTLFRRFFATWKKSFTRGNSLLLRWFAALHSGCWPEESHTYWLLNYVFNVSRFWQLNYFSKFSNTLGLYSVTLINILIIQSAHSLTTDPQPLPKPVLHRLRSSASSFNFQYRLVSLRSSSSCLHLLPRLSHSSPSLTFNNVF